MADHKKDPTATAEKRKQYTALLKKNGVTADTGTRHLSGGRRAQCKAALNWLNNNPAPKKRPIKNRKKEG